MPNPRLSVLTLLEVSWCWNWSNSLFHRHRICRQKQTLSDLLGYRFCQGLTDFVIDFLIKILFKRLSDKFLTLVRKFSIVYFLKQTERHCYMIDKYTTRIRLKINVSTDHMEWHPILWQRRESTLCQTLHVRLASDTHKIQSSFLAQMMLCDLT